MGDVCCCSSVDYKVIETNDREIIRSVISSPDIIDGFTTPEKLDKYINNFPSSNTCYLFKYQEEIAGIAMILYASSDIIDCKMVIADIGFYKRFRGKVTVILLRKGINKFFDENECNMLLAKVSKKNKSALINVKWIGFKVFDEDDNHYFLRYRKDGKQ